MAVTFDATPDVDAARVVINAEGGVTGDRFYMIRRDENGSNLIRETSEAGALWLKDPAKVRTNLALNGGASGVTGALAVLRTNLATNPNAASVTNYAAVAGTGGTAALTNTTLASRSGATGNRVTWSVATTAVSGGGSYTQTGLAPSIAYATSIWVKSSKAQTLRLTSDFYTSGMVYVNNAIGANVAVSANTWTRLFVTGTSGAGVDRVVMTVAAVTGGAVWAVNDTLDLEDVLIESGSLLNENFSGATTASTDFSYVWTGTADASTSQQKAAIVTDFTASANAVAIQVSDWASTGTKSLRVAPTSSTANDTYANIGAGDSGALRAGLVAGKSYTISATARLAATQTETLVADARKIVVYTKVGAAAAVKATSSAAPNAAGTLRLSVSVAVPVGATEAYIRLYAGGVKGNDVWWDDILVEESAVLRTNLATNPSFETASGTVNVRTNLHTNPGAISTAKFSSWSGNAPNTTAVSVENATWAQSGKAYRVAWTNADSPNTGDMGVSAVDVPPGVKCTIVYKMVVSRAITVTQSTMYASSGVLTVHARSHATDVTLPAGTPTTRWVTFTADAAAITAAVRSIQTLREKVAGDYAEVSEVDLYEGDYQPSRAFFYGATAAAGDFTYAWSGAANASTSYQQAPGVAAAVATSLAANIQSSEWILSGSKSIRSIPVSTSNGSYASPGGDVGAMRLGMQAGKTYTISATLRLAAAQTGDLHLYARKIAGFTKATAGSSALEYPSISAPNAAGSSRISLTMTIPTGVAEAFVRLYNGASAGNGDVWWDDFLVEEVSTLQPYFDGSTTPTAGNSNFWAGDPHASVSHEFVAAKTFFDGSTGPNHIWNGTANASTSRNEDAALPIELSDYEARQGMETDYILTDQDGLSSGSKRITIPKWGTWIKDPFRPFMNVKVMWGADSSYTRPVERAILQARGAKFPVVQHERRMAPNGNIRITTEERITAKNLTALLDMTNVVMLDVDADFGVPVRYVSIGDVSGQRVGADDRDLKWEARHWDLPIQEVAIPVGAPIAQTLTYDSLAASFGSYIAISAIVPTYNDIAVGNWGQ